jgi:hypothetical protein
MLKAKLHLDMFTLDLKIVAEYPDLVEENHRLNNEADQMRVKDES